MVSLGCSKVTFGYFSCSVLLFWFMGFVLFPQKPNRQEYPDQVIRAIDAAIVCLICLACLSLQEPSPLFLSQDLEPSWVLIQKFSEPHVQNSQ